MYGRATYRYSPVSYIFAVAAASAVGFVVMAPLADVMRMEMAFTLSEDGNHAGRLLAATCDLWQC